MEFPKPTNRQTAKEKQRSRYETLIFTRLVLLVAVPLLIVGLLCGILYYRSEFARGRAKLGEVAGNASMRMTSVFDGLRSYYLAALRNSSFTWMESCSEIPYSRYSDLRDAQELLRGGTYMDSYVVGYEYINLRYGWVLSNYGTFPLEQMKNQEEIRTFIDNQASQTATLYWVNRTGAAPRQTSSLWLNVSGQCLVARITSAKNGLVGMLLIHLDMEYLSELAGEWKSLGYDVVLLDANGETVTTTDTELAHALADAGDLSDGHLRIPGTISNYLVQGQAINFNGITCYAAYDEQQNLGSSVAAFWVSVLILLATVVVLLVCRWNSAFLYRPIRELLDQAYDVFGRREQNQDEFDYLTSSVTRAAQNQKDMQKLVQAQRRQLEQQFLLHILRSEASLEAIHSTMQEFGIQPFACYRLLVLSIVFEKQMTGSVREAVAQTVAQRLPAEICRRLFFCPVAVDATVVMVAGAENEETLAHNVETVYKGAAKVVSAGMGCRCVAGVSRVFTSPEQIASAWHEASEALRSRGAASEEMRQDLTYYTTAEDNHTEHGYDTLLENEIITYNRLDAAYDQDVFTRATLRGKLDVNAMEANRSLYSHVIYDSDNERRFAQELDVSDQVAVYVKLPGSFYISTPVGKYNPDWAIAFNEGSVKHIYFVAETKGNLDTMELRGVENAKIECAKKHFAAISNGSVVYSVVDNYSTLMQLVSN